MQELDSKILEKANIVCSDSKIVCSQNGELHHALDKGLIKENKVVELGEAITKKIQRKENDITICDLVGIGFQDAVIASCVMEEYNKLKKNENNELIK